MKDAAVKGYFVYMDIDAAGEPERLSFSLPGGRGGLENKLQW